MPDVLGSGLLEPGMEEGFIPQNFGKEDDREAEAHSTVTADSFSVHLGAFTPDQGAGRLLMLAQNQAEGGSDGELEWLLLSSQDPMSAFRSVYALPPKHIKIMRASCSQQTMYTCCNIDGK